MIEEIEKEMPRKGSGENEGKKVEGELRLAVAGCGELQ